MPENQKSDDEVVAEERRRSRALNRIIILTILFGVFVGGLIGGAFHSGIPQRLGVWAGASDIAIAWLPLVLLIFLWRMFVLYRAHIPQPEALRENVQKRLVDDYTRRQRFILASFIALTILLTINTSEMHDSGSDTSGVSLAAFVFYMLLAALMVVFGPGFLNARFRTAHQDEASRTLRARSTAVGYITAMVAMAADYGISRFAPALLKTAIPLSLAAGFIAPAFYYIVADWRAEREG